MYSIMPSANSDDFISSFPVCISFYSLIAMARTSKSMLDKSGKSGHPCLVADLKRNALLFMIENDVLLLILKEMLCFSSLRMMFAVGLLYMPFIILRYVPSLPTFWRIFVINWCGILLKAFSAFIEISYGFCVSIC